MENAEDPIHFQAPTMEELEPLFPAYELEAFVAQGGMGAVYKARQISLDRPVAIKILPREFGQDEKFRASFEAEAKAMARLNHPNLIGVYDFGDANGMLYLVMEYVEGKSLYHSSYGKAIDPTQASEIVAAICRALDHAHSAGILHRDIKPANILLTPDATPKIGDFGLARPMNQTEDPEDVIYGTPGYTAPEVIHRQPVDHRADIFSIGVLLHELLTGALPDEQHTPPSLIAQTPVAYDQIVRLSTQKEPNLRYNSAADFADALEKAAQSPALNRPLMNVASAAPGQAPISSPVTAPAKKSPALAVALITVAAIAIAAFFLTRKGEEAPKKLTTTPTEEKPTTPSTPTEPATTPIEPVVLETKTIPTPKPEPEPTKESALKGLARLKNQLASGQRDEFPLQTKARNGSHFLSIAKTFTWQQAIRFAEEHGAHLAIFPTREDREWAIAQLHLKDPAFIGAGIAANNQWQWQDATPWEDTTKPKPLSQAETVLTLSTVGTLTAENPNRALPIILQWRDDANNPATIEAQLKRTKESIENDGLANARYPVGTRTYKQSHFLLLPREMSWNAASEFAKSYQAALAVPSSPDENHWLVKTFSNSKPTFPIGGYKLNEQSPWMWLTREAWHSSGWAANEPSSDPAKNRILMRITSPAETGTWISTTGDKGDTTHVLLEWSKPVIAKTTRAKFDLDQWLTGVNRKIADRVSPLIEDYEEQREELIDDYIRDMKRAAKKIDIPGGRKGRAARAALIIENLVDQAMEEVEESGELPKNLPKRSPQVFKDITNQAKDTVEKLDTTHQADLKKELDFYTNGLLKKATDIAKQGFTQQANQLQETVNGIGEDTAKFVSKLGL